MVSQASTQSARPSDAIAKAMANIVRFREVRPNWNPMRTDNPAYHAAMYKYFDGASSTFVKGASPAVESDEFRLAVGVVEPGKGQLLHNHSQEELMFAASGSWMVYFDEKEEHKVFLEQWDSILVPAGVPRGWRNVGTATGCFLNLSGVHDRMSVVMPDEADGSSPADAGCGS